MIKLTKKSFLVIIAILSVWSITMTGCTKDDKDDDKNKTTPGFSYKVDGVEFKSDLTISGYDTTSDGKDKLTLVALSNTDTTKLIGLNFYGRTTGTYNISDVDENFATYATTTNKKDSIFFSSKGNITITNYDATAKKISGTFAFEAEELVIVGIPKIKKITEGKFTDIPYKILPE